MLADFQNSFTGSLSSKFTVKRSLEIPSYSNAPLHYLWKIISFQNRWHRVETAVTDLLFVDSEVKVWYGILGFNVPLDTV